MRVIFFGNGFEYSLCFMEALAAMDSVDLVAVVSPVRGTQRREWRRVAASLAARLPQVVRRSLPGGSDTQFPIRATQIAQKTGAKLFWPDSVNDCTLVDELFYMEPDVVVMAGFNEILKPVVLGDLSPVLNVHPSLLPDFRGPHPEFWIVAEGAETSGVTIHLVDEGVDTGAIVAQERFEVEPWLTGGALQKRAMRVGAGLLEKTLRGFGAEGRMQSWSQGGEGSYYPKVSFETLVVPFGEPSSVVYNRARAASPWTPLVLFVPRVWWDRRGFGSTAASTSAAPGMVRLRLSGAVPFEQHHIGAPGTVRRSEEGGLAVSCGPGVVYFEKVSL